jgi:hypothetical protein
MRRVLLLVLLLIVAAIPAAAIPVTGAASAVSNNNFTIACTGASGETFLKWGTQEAAPLVWSANETPSAGTATITVAGSPILPSMLYYAKCCDETGCDATPVSFTTSAITPIATTTLGSGIKNLTKNRFNVLYLGEKVAEPYSWLFPSDEKQTGIALVFGLAMFAVFAGIWLRTRSVAVPLIMGLLSGSFLLYSTQGLMMGIPVEFIGIAQGMFYAAFAGTLLYFFKK